MKKWIWVVLATALCCAGTTALRAADEPADKLPGRAEAGKAPDELIKLPQAEREARMKEWRKTNGGPNRAEWEKRREQMEKMTPEQREAKRKEIKERLEKRIAELRARQTNATITAQETSELGRSEKVLKRFDQNGPPPRGERLKAIEPAAPPPPDK